MRKSPSPKPVTDLLDDAQPSASISATVMQRRRDGTKPNCPIRCASNSDVLLKNSPHAEQWVFGIEFMSPPENPIQTTHTAAHSANDQQNHAICRSALRFSSGRLRVSAFVLCDLTLKCLDRRFRRRRECPPSDLGDFLQSVTMLLWNSERRGFLEVCVYVTHVRNGTNDNIGVSSVFRTGLLHFVT